ncbi:MAG: OmpA family protein [Rubrivivax sp.]
MAAAPPPPPPPILPFDDAVLSAANNLFEKAQLPPEGRFTLVIDPLIDGITGMQTRSTQAMGARIVKLVESKFPRYQVRDFSAASVQQGPLVLIGTFTGVNAQRKTEGQRQAYRICLALADLKTGKLVSKGLAFASTEGVDPTPLAFFRDAPATAEDGATLGYIRTCQGTKAGDPIHPQYIDRIVTAATIAEAIDAYDERKYADALTLYETARAAPGGEQLRVFTGLYLTNLRLGRTSAASSAFGDIVQQGLTSKRLGIKFLFRPGTAALWTDPRAGPVPYPIWVEQIARNADQRQSCLEVVGHTSATGPEPLNERLSLLRAEVVRTQLLREKPALEKRLIASGMGSRETLVGNARDDASDALDRRVEMKVIGGC